MGKHCGELMQYDPSSNGPIHNRSCTDVLFLIAFIVFLVLWGFVGYHGMTQGNMKNLLAPSDSQGRRCGLKSLEDKKYLVFVDITKCLSPGTTITGCPTTQVCVNKCPDSTVFFHNEETFDQYKSSMVCVDTVDIKNLTWTQAKQYFKEQKCTEFVIRSEPAQIVQDLVQSRWYLLGALFAVIIFCFIYILLLRWVVAPVVWTFIAGFFALLGFLLYLCYKNYAYYKANPVIQTINPEVDWSAYWQFILSKHETWIAMIIAVAVIFVILLFVIIFLRGRIVLAIALIREGSKAVYAVKSTVFFPIFPWILQCLVIAYGVLVLMYLTSIGESAFKVVNLKNDTDCNCQGAYTEDYVSCHPVTFMIKCHKEGGGFCSQATCHFTGIDNPQSVIWMQLINVFGFFWTKFFISGVSDMILANTFSTWYWTFRKSDLPFFTLTTGIYRTVRYHLGTVAFGALIIAIIRVIRIILEYIDHKLKKFDNIITRCILCFCKCVFWCLEKFLKFINKNAYIMCAVHGKNFCLSAKDAFSLLMRNMVRVVVLDKVTDFIFFLSKVLISIGAGFAMYYFLECKLVYEVTKGEPLHNNYMPAIILGIATYLICTIFFNVYAMAVDTLFLCFLEDCERNDGSAEKPYFMSKNLMKILGKSNKKN